MNHGTARDTAPPETQHRPRHGPLPLPAALETRRGRRRRVHAARAHLTDDLRTAASGEPHMGEKDVRKRSAIFRWNYADRPRSSRWVDSLPCAQRGVGAHGSESTHHGVMSEIAEYQRNLTIASPDALPPMCVPPSQDHREHRDGAARVARTHLLTRPEPTRGRGRQDSPRGPVRARYDSAQADAGIGGAHRGAAHIEDGAAGAIWCAGRASRANGVMHPLNSQAD